MPYTNLPTSHSLIKEYIAKNKGNTEINLGLRKFIYRYRLAKSFTEAKFDGFSKQTEKGYNCGLKMMLCYSAYDESMTIEKLIKKNNRHAIRMDNSNIELANDIRKNELLKILLEKAENVNEKKLIKKIQNFYNKENDDIFCIAMGLRHTFAHGEFTAGGAGLDIVRHGKIINELSDIILVKSDMLVRECILLGYRRK